MTVAEVVSGGDFNIDGYEIYVNGNHAELSTIVLPGQLVAFLERRALYWTTNEPNLRGQLEQSFRDNSGLEGSDYAF